MTCLEAIRRASMEIQCLIAGLFLRQVFWALSWNKPMSPTPTSTASGNVAMGPLIRAPGHGSSTGTR